MALVKSLLQELADNFVAAIKVIVSKDLTTEDVCRIGLLFDSIDTDCDMVDITLSSESTKDTLLWEFISQLKASRNRAWVLEALAKFSTVRGDAELEEAIAEVFIFPELVDYRKRIQGSL